MGRASRPVRSGRQRPHSFLVALKQEENFEGPRSGQGPDRCGPPQHGSWGWATHHVTSFYVPKPSLSPACAWRSGKGICLLRFLCPKLPWTQEPTCGQDPRWPHHTHSYLTPFESLWQFCLLWGEKCEPPPGSRIGGL